MMNSNSPLIRCIEYLNLSAEYEQLARDLMAQSDMPIVFWINAELPLNYRHRSPGQKNEFWVTIPPNCSEDERLRLILGGLHGAVQEQRRYWRTDIQPEYEVSLKALPDTQKLRMYYAFLGRIGNLATTLDVEWFLSLYGIATSRRIRQYYFRDRTTKLKEYINLHDPQKTQPSITWSRETEVVNLLEYGNYYRLGAEYRRDLERLLPKANPSYVNEVRWVANLIAGLQQSYNGSNGAELTEEFLTAVIEHFQIEHMVRLCKHEAYRGIYPIDSENKADILSYVLNSWPRQSDLINWLRYAREILCVYRTEMNYQTPDVTMNLIDTDISNSYADGDCKQGYCISFTNGLIYQITDAVKTWELSSDLSTLIAYIGEDKVRHHLLRQAIFFISAHEYAHIINGDCDRSTQLAADDREGTSAEREAIEERANRTAIQLIQQSIPWLYRFPPAPDGEHERMREALRAGGPEAMRRVISKERENEMRQEVRELISKQCRDQLLAYEAVNLVQSLLPRKMAQHVQ